MTPVPKARMRIPPCTILSDAPAYRVPNDACLQWAGESEGQTDSLCPPGPGRRNLSLRASASLNAGAQRNQAAPSRSGFLL